MNRARLPDGFVVQVDRRVRVLNDGSALLGGSPTRLLHLAPAAQNILSDGRITVRDATSAHLARTLLDATVAHPRPSSGPSHRDITVVIPVRDNYSGLHRLVALLRGLRVIVVDDGSSLPIESADFTDVHSDITVLRHPQSCGPAAARNTGLAACSTEFVCFLDSDVVPRRGWLEALLGHFCDPTVALVAPRIVGLAHSDRWLARYEAMHSSLDLGRREAPILPYGTVSYVPSAAIICRRSALAEVGGFDETLHSGEDVDLCWRLVESGARLRYEPIALVAHDHRIQMRQWMTRKAFYGSSAAPLAMRHPDKTAPLIVSGWTLAAWILMGVGSGMGNLGSLVVALVTGRRVATAMRSANAPLAEVVIVAVRGLYSAAMQLAVAICRHYWPVALVAALVSRKCRRVVVIAAIVEGTVDWLRRRNAVIDDDDDVRSLGLPTYLLIKRVDDLAYGVGLWSGVVRGRTMAPLKPKIQI